MRSDTVVATIVGLVRLDFFFFFLVESLNRETILEFETPPPPSQPHFLLPFFGGGREGEVKGLFLMGGGDSFLLFESNCERKRSGDQPRHSVGSLHNPGALPSPASHRKSTI